MPETNEKILNFLKTWAENYFKSRDAFQKSIQSIEQLPNGIMITYKDKKEKIIVSLTLSEINEPELQDAAALITINSSDNVDFLAENWKKFLKYPHLKVYFINPFSLTEKKWVISPHVHDKICDSVALKQGLLSMFGTCEPLTKELLESRIQ
jgi:hypothetical protein